MIITSLGVYVFSLGFMILILFHETQVCQKYKLQIVLFIFLFSFLSAVVEMLYGCYIN